MIVTQFLDLTIINVTAFVAGWAAASWWKKHRRERP